MTPEETIQEAARRIAERFHPARIILFGSRARGTPDRHSDVDLIVIFDRVDDPFALGTEVRTPLNGLGTPFDIVVMSLAEFERESDLPGFVRVAAREGRVLYDRAA